MAHPRVPFLRQIDLFAELPTESLEQIAEVAGLQRFTERAYFFREGEEPDFVCSLIQGGAVLLSDSPENEAVVEFFGPGETILLAAAILGLPYLVSARATSDGQALLIPAGKFRQLLDTGNALAAQCARVLSRHWCLLVHQIKEIKTRDAAERLAHFLLTQAAIEHGEATLTLPGMKKEIATRIGIRPATLSRAIRKLRVYGVETKGDCVHIASVERLAELARPQPGKALIKV